MRRGQLVRRPARHSSGNAVPSARRQADRPNDAVARLDGQFKRLATRMERMEREFDDVKKAWDKMGTSRQGVREQVEKNGADLGVQFQRIAMMQAEIDRLKANETALQTEIVQLRAKDRR